MNEIENINCLIFDSNDVQDSLFIIRRYKNIKDYWTFPRAHRKIPNKTIRSVIEIFALELIGKKNSPVLEDRLRELLTKERAMLPAIDRKTGEKIIQSKKKFGTIRTIISEYIVIGLIHRNEKGIICFTLAGEEIYKCLNRSEEVINRTINKTIDRLLLKVQFANEYFLSPRVRMSPKIIIKPFLFLLKLLRDDRINFLTREEFCIPYVIAKSIEDYENVVEKIIKHRNGTSLEDAIGVPFLDTVPNQCFHTILESRRLIEKKENKFIINNEQLDFIDKELKSYKDSTRIVTIKEHGDLHRGVKRVNDEEDALQYLTLLEPKYPSMAPYEELIKRDYLKGQQNILLPVLRKNFSKIGSGYGPYVEDIFNHPEKNIEAEIETLKIFEQNLNFESKRTSKIKNDEIRGNHSDVLNIFEQENKCGIIDSKTNKERNYTLPIGDHRAMVGYITSYRTLLTSLGITKSLELAYACFVTSGFKKTIINALEQLKKEAGGIVPIVAISIYDLLCISEMKPDPKKFIEIMSKGGIITRADFL
jgi:hypothetical protein